jgi:hypothetical protein
MKKTQEKKTSKKATINALLARGKASELRSKKTAKRPPSMADMVEKLAAITALMKALPDRISEAIEIALREREQRITHAGLDQRGANDDEKGGR